MSEAWVELDGVREGELPAHASDGRSGDRVGFLESGLLHVRDGRAVFARWSDVLGVLAHDGAAYVLLPRRPPSQPWVEVDRAMLGDEPDAVKAFARRVSERGSGGGYRDAVRKRRQNLTDTALESKVRRREPVPGALEVPSTIVLGRRYPWLGAVQLGALGLGGVLGYFAFVGIFMATMAMPRDARPLAMLFSYAMPVVGVVLGAWGAREIGRRWRAAKDRTLPRQRVLVLAPDGCVVGFRGGVRTLKWTQVGEFGTGPTEPNYDMGLVVRAPNGDKLGDLDAGWLDAPLRLVVAVAEAYRKAAR
ncbi:MAG TPA: hypothetical protein RMH99_28185 [Sandaracinaceae bacterium LLY-WYZ-13_1]|nr:hypothetical protein [Sandaracinaceae bacterium LLY-WYZ-13_1]